MAEGAENIDGVGIPPLDLCVYGSDCHCRENPLATGNLGMIWKAVLSYSGKSVVVTVVRLKVNRAEGATEDRFKEGLDVVRW